MRTALPELLTTKVTFPLLTELSFGSVINARLLVPDVYSEAVPTYVDPT